MSVTRIVMAFSIIVVLFNTWIKKFIEPYVCTQVIIFRHLTIKTLTSTKYLFTSLDTQVLNYKNNVLSDVVLQQNYCTLATEFPYVPMSLHLIWDMKSKNMHLRSHTTFLMTFHGG